MSTIDEKLRANRDRYQRRLEEIQRDTDLTAEAKARRIEPIYREAKALDSKLRGERLEGLREKVRSAELRSLEAHVRRLEAGADEVGTAPEADLMKGVEPDNEIAAVVREIERLERLDHAPEGSTR